ncbi:MAG TPA: hypothetical protein VJX94_04770 [Stellaceae bacterium]|nr:hypothetical protein [Stellaceae bacterium]
MKLITTATARLWKNRKSSATFVALAIGFSIPAQADPIYINGDFSPALTFAQVVPLPSDNVEVMTVSGFGCSNCASYGFAGPYNGTATFGPTDFVAGPLETNTPITGVSTFPVPAPGYPAGLETFTYASGSNSDTLTALISWNTVQDATEVQLQGTGTVTTVNVDPSDTSSFGTEWQMGEPVQMAVAYFPIGAGGCDLATLVTTGCPGGIVPVTMELSYFEGASVTPGQPGLPGGGPPPLIDAPEPMSSFVALSIALCCAWGMYPLIRRQRSRS